MKLSTGDAVTAGAQKPLSVIVDEVKPIDCQPKDWDEVDAMFEELKQKYRVGGGEGLRAELISTIVGGRLVVVFDWEDM